MSTPTGMTVERGLERSLRRYVLGTLEEQPRLEIEGRLISEPETFDMLGVIEQELTEDYLEGALSKSERNDYERHFLTSADHQRQLGFMRALREAASSTASHRLPAPSPSLWSRIRGLFRLELALEAAYVGALVLLVGVAVWSVVAQRQLRTELADLRAEHAREQRAEADRTARRDVAPGIGQTLQSAVRPADVRAGQASGSQPARNAVLLLPQNIPTFALAATLLRSEGALTRVSIPSGTAAVRFRLDVPGEPYASYRVALYDGNADERCALSGLHASLQAGHPTLTLVLPADLLPRGDYQLKVSGVTTGGGLDAVASYTIRVSGQ